MTSQARIAVDLKELRNSSVFAFFMVNALFVLIVFLLQLNKDNLHVKWPLGVKTNITYDETTQEVIFLGTSSDSEESFSYKIVISLHIDVPNRTFFNIFFSFFFPANAYDTGQSRQGFD